MHGAEGITDPRLVCGSHDSASVVLVLTSGGVGCIWVSHALKLLLHLFVLIHLLDPDDPTVNC